MTKLCLCCNTPFEPVGRAKYCSTPCRRRAGRMVKLGRPPGYQPPLLRKACGRCGQPFATREERQKYCSAQCSAASWRNSATKVCGVEHCPKPVRARGLCSTHYNDAYTDRGRRDGSPETRRLSLERHSAKRRAQKQGVSGSIERIACADIAARDGWSCWLCPEPMDPAVRHPDPMSPSKDHVIPLGRGGEHTLENLRLAHLICNLRRGLGRLEPPR